MRINQFSFLMIVGTFFSASCFADISIESNEILESQTIHTEGRNFQLECWQNGKQIFNQAGLQGMTLGSMLNGNTISFQKSNQAGTSVVLIPFDDSLCLTTSESSLK